MTKKRENKKTDIKSRALNLLSYRARSIFELTLALKKRDFDDLSIEGVISWLKEFGYLNDENFATELSESRKRNKGWGRKKIAFDLSKRGISGDLITGILDDFSEDEEESIAEKALNNWIKKRGAGVPLEGKLFESAFRHLLSRGFPSSTIYRVIKNLEPQSEK